MPPSLAPIRLAVTGDTGNKGHKEEQERPVRTLALQGRLRGEQVTLPSVSFFSIPRLPSWGVGEGMGSLITESREILSIQTHLDSPHVPPRRAMELTEMPQMEFRVYDRKARKVFGRR